MFQNLTHIREMEEEMENSDAAEVTQLMSMESGEGYGNELSQFVGRI